MPPSNPFLDLPAELKARADPAAANLAKLSGMLPMGSQADESSYYACAAGLTVAETQRRLLERAGIVCVLARFVAFDDLLPLSVDVVMERTSNASPATSKMPPGTLDQSASTLHSPSRIELNGEQEASHGRSHTV